jgi:predicted nucleic acid-binding protein
MILVDSSVWIDYFNGVETTETALLDEFLSTDAICIGDIILAEVLQGFRSDRDYKLAKEILTELPIYQIVTPELAGLRLSVLKIEFPCFSAIKTLIPTSSIWALGNLEDTHNAPHQRHIAVSEASSNVSGCMRLLALT